MNNIPYTLEREDEALLLNVQFRLFADGEVEVESVAGDDGEEVVLTEAEEHDLYSFLFDATIDQTDWEVR